MSGRATGDAIARDECTADPKRPGRKVGQGLFSYREKPTAGQVDETKKAQLDCCPECCGAVADVKEYEQFVIDLSDIEVKITRYETESGSYSGCGRCMRSRHPEQIPAATGAAGVMMIEQPRAKALAADLKHRLGVPFAKICEVLEVDADWGLPGGYTFG
jgi:hypothetical protein